MIIFDSEKFEEKVNELVQVYKCGCLDPLDGDEVENLADLVESYANWNEGNSTDKEYEKSRKLLIEKYFVILNQGEGYGKPECN